MVNLHGYELMNAFLSDKGVNVRSDFRIFNLLIQVIGIVKPPDFGLQKEEKKSRA